MAAHRTPASSPAAGRTRAAIGWVFLDRDGTLNVSPVPGEYIERPDELALIPGAAEAVALFNRAGIWTGVVTNQRGVALGRMSVADLDAVHERLGELLAQRSASLDAIYACPHEAGSCDCRKPKPGLLLEAAKDNPKIEFARAAIVGDSASDMQVGRSLGLTTILISAPDGDRDARAQADHVVADALAAARLLTMGMPQSPPADISGAATDS